MKCPTCGAENEAGNRFCEQCGSRMEPSGTFTPPPSNNAAQPAVASATCPACGASVLPGEAFCDECGASLTGVAPIATAAVSNDAPTILATPAPVVQPSTSGAPTVICPACGQTNLATDHFCDHCGATLPAASADNGPAVAADAPTMMADQALLQALNATPLPDADPDANAITVTSPDSAPTPVPSTNSALAEAPTIEQPMIHVDSDAQAAYEAEQQRLNEEIARQQQIIAQFEQMQAMFGAAAPAAVTQGLADARDALAKAESDLAALQPPPPPAPPVDPAEVARLNEEIARQQQIIAQFEQMQAMFGAAAPAAVAQGLADAREALAKAESDLAALTGGIAPVASIPTPTPAATEATTAVPSAPASPAIEAATTPEPVAPVVPSEPVAVSEPISPIPTPAAPPAPVVPPAPGARLVMDNGQDLTLPNDKREIIIGREDPISGIFPEIDLTPFGGETGGVSRQHAQINHDSDRWTVIDLNSTNYTRVNGNKIDPNTPVPIQDGTRLQFGRIAMTFRA